MAQLITLPKCGLFFVTFFFLLHGSVFRRYSEYGSLLSVLGSYSYSHINALSAHSLKASIHRVKMDNFNPKQLLVRLTLVLANQWHCDWKEVSCAWNFLTGVRRKISRERWFPECCWREHSSFTWCRYGHFGRLYLPIWLCVRKTIVHQMIVCSMVVQQSTHFYLMCMTALSLWLYR